VKRAVWIALLAAVAFVVIVLARMPAAWVLPARGPQWACGSIDGSLWSGTCAGLTLFGQRLIARNLVADLPLDPALLPSVPAGLHGRAHAELALAEVQRGVIRQLQGRIEARNLEERSGNNTALGSYAVSFPGGSGDLVGTLRDLEGPLALEGTLRLTPAPGFELEGVIAARRDAPPELVNSLRFLGSPDATGRRPFAMSGTF